MVRLLNHPEFSCRPYFVCCSLDGFTAAEGLCLFSRVQVHVDGVIGAKSTPGSWLVVQDCLRCPRHGVFPSGALCISGDFKASGYPSYPRYWTHIRTSPEVSLLEGTSRECLEGNPKNTRRVVLEKQHGALLSMQIYNRR